MIPNYVSMALHPRNPEGATETPTKLLGLISLGHIELGVVVLGVLSYFALQPER